MNLLFLQRQNWSQKFWCKIDKKDYNEINIYYIGYVTVKNFTNCNNINSVNPLCLMIDEMTVHFEEKNENKYLVLEKYEEVFRSMKPCEF